MAVHQPNTRIIRLEGQYQVAMGRQHHNVSPRRVLELQSRVGGGVAAPCLREDVHIVAVEVDRVVLQNSR